jgi:hypothetical protein
MKTLNLFFLLFVALSMNISCSAQPDKKTEIAEVKKGDYVEVFYFHSTRRCVTCIAVEEVSKASVAELYGETVTFTGYNLDEPEAARKAEELEISGQTLLIVSGDIKIDITNDGFMNARSNPDKLKQIIKGKIDPLI